jgi:tripartite-type tricarboxylate transporter receptor subunit TctC
MIKATKDPKFVKVLEEAGVEPIAAGPEKFAEMIKSELPVWKKAVEIAGVKIQQ